MSRKKAEKSKPPIGIFLDKKSVNYNLSILEILFSQEATTWQIAEILQKKKYTTIKNQDTQRYRTQKIYSVIQRKGGRLDDLKNKGYITIRYKDKDGDHWDYTLKGLIALYVKEPELVTKTLEQEEKDRPKLVHAWLDELLSEPDFKPVEEEIEFPEPQKTFMKQITTTNSSENRFIFYTTFLKEAEFLVSRGIINLDRISKDDLLNLISHKSTINSLLHTEISEEK